MRGVRLPAPAPRRMTPPADLAEILQCPVSGRPLAEVEGPALDRLRGALAAGAAFADGGPVPDPVERAFQDADGERTYVQVGSIVYLTPDKAVRLDRGDAAPAPRAAEEKRDVQTFYNDTGWKKEEGQYVDSKLFSQVGTAASRYKERALGRIGRHLGGGRYLLDAASGTVPRGTATPYAQAFERHVCLDLSLTALTEARANLGEKGVYILGDVTRLPIREGSMDGCVSLHTIYHVPKDEQETAFLELHRVLKPGGTAAVVYNWGRHAVLPNLLTLPVQLARYVGKRTMPKERGGRPTLRTLYFHAHSPAWFESRAWPFRYEITAFQSPNNPFLNLYGRDNALGRRVLDAVARLEERWPERMGRLGYYPLLVLHKAARA